MALGTVNVPGNTLNPLKLLPSSYKFEWNNDFTDISFYTIVNGSELSIDGMPDNIGNAAGGSGSINPYDLEWLVIQHCINDEIIQTAFIINNYRFNAIHTGFRRKLKDGVGSNWVAIEENFDSLRREINELYGLAHKEEKEFGTNNVDKNDSRHLLPGLVPDSHTGAQVNAFLKNDGTWDNPNFHNLGEFSVTGSPGQTTINFTFVPKIIKVWSKSDGSLCNILTYSGSGTAFTNYDAGGTGSVGGMANAINSNNFRWTVMANTGSYLYEARKY